MPDYTHRNGTWPLDPKYMAAPKQSNQAVTPYNEQQFEAAPKPTQDHPIKLGKKNKYAEGEQIL